MTAIALAAMVWTTGPAGAQDITFDSKFDPRKEILPVSHSRSFWNLGHLNPATGVGEGVVAFAWLNKKDLPSENAARAAWFKTEILRIEQKLGLGGKITVHPPANFSPSKIGGGKSFTGEFSVEYAAHSLFNPVYIIPILQGRDRLVVFGLNGDDVVVAKAASDFADTWAARMRDVSPADSR